MSKPGYQPLEVRGREPVEVKEWPPERDPGECFRFRYYVQSDGDVEELARRIALEETTGRWIGRFAAPTSTYAGARAQAVRVERYGPGEAIIEVLSPVCNIDADADPDIDVPLYAHCGGLAVLTTGPRRIDAKAMWQAVDACRNRPS